jgi:hypothetical protein
MRKLGIILLAGLGLLIGLLIWNVNRTADAQTFTLKDGNRLTFRTVTVGTNERVNFGSGWERLLSRLPGKHGAKFRRNSWTDDSSEEAVVFWFTYDRPPTDDSYLDLKFDGASSWNSHSFHLPPRTLPGGKIITLSGARNWPRREKTFAVEIIDSGLNGEKYDRLGTLKVKNPAFRSFPEWKAEPLPATRRVDDMAFELVTTRAKRTNAEGQWVESAFFRVTRDGKLDADWEACSYRVEDASGNHFQFQPASPRYTPRGPRAYSDSNGVVACPIGWLAWPTEKAWKVGIEFVRTRRIESNEVFVLRGVPARAAAGRTTDTWTTNIAAGVVELHHEPDWNKPGRPPRVDAFEVVRSDFANERNNPLRVLLLEAVTDRGQKLTPLEQRRIDVPAESQTLDVTIAVPKRYFVQYMVEPVVFPPTNAAPVWRD